MPGSIPVVDRPKGSKSSAKGRQRGQEDQSSISSTPGHKQKEEEEEEEAEEDAADILDIALPSLFDIPPIAFSSRPNSLHTYTPPQGTGDDIHLRIPDPSAENYTKLQANQLWLSAVYLSDLVHLGLVPVSGLRIAELGAAAGLPGVSACRKGARVVGTDWGDEDILSTLRDNFSRTCGEDQIEGGGKKWAVRGHEWGTDITPLVTALGPDGHGQLEGTEKPAEGGERSGDRFDRLLLADTLWVTEAHSALLDSVYALIKPGGVAHIAAGLHTGRGPLGRFIAAAQARGGKVENQREVMWRKDGGWNDVVVHTTGLEEERGVVVYFELRVPE